MATMIKTKKTKRECYDILKSQLETERSSFITHWRDLGDYILPRRPRFLLTDMNRGEKKNTKILDSTATTAARTLRSGMMGGITSPARPWFRLTTPEPAIAEQASVKEWLDVVGTRMSTVFLRSNLYNTLPIIYGDIGVFGTSAMMIEEDFDEVIRTTAFPVGSYMVANDSKGRVRTFFREFNMTVRQLVEKFGEREDGEIVWDNFSSLVKEMWKSDQKDAWVNVCHVITENEDYDEDALESKNKKWASCYYESGTRSGGNTYNINKEVFLRESGFDYFPVLVPRWEVTGEDSYATECPGMTALGDIKQLQVGEKRAAQAIEKMVNPALVGPPSLKTTKVSLLPGDMNYVDESSGGKGLHPLHEVNPRIAELEQKQEQLRQRIRRVFFEDLFLMMANTDRREITAREIDERREEKLLALGPVLEQLNQDLLDPLIDITFDIMLNQGMLPEPPDEMRGMTLKVEYISIMAQAQKQLGIGSMERFVRFVGETVAATQDTTMLDKLNADQTMDVMGDLLSVPPGVVRTDEEVEKIRENRAKAQQAQAQLQAAESAAKSAKTLSETDMGKDSALRALLAQSKAGQVVQQ